MSKYHSPPFLFQKLKSDKKEYLLYVKGKVVKTAREYTKFAGE